MNWDRARREYRAAVAYDYSARQDDLERGLSELDRWERRPKRKLASKNTSSSGAVRPSDVPAAVDQLLRSHLKDAAKKEGVGRKQLYKRRVERFRAGEPLEAIVGQYVKIPAGLGQRAKPRPVPKPSSKRIVSSGRDRVSGAKQTGAATLRKPPIKKSKGARAAAEARRRGITVEQLKRERRANAEADQALSQEAKALGITTKELRRRLEADGPKPGL